MKNIFLVLALAITTAGAAKRAIPRARNSNIFFMTTSQSHHRLISVRNNGVNAKVYPQAAVAVVVAPAASVTALI